MIFTIGNIAVAIAMCFCAILLIKNKVTFKNHEEISNAIFQYTMDQLYNGNLTEADNNFYSQIESYDKTMWRLWDYGYKNIVPKETLAKIEPYIGVRKYHH